MTQRYRLPCPHCADHLEVALPQAGETLSCVCGAQVVVPALRELRRLDPVADTLATSDRSHNWDLRRGSLFVTGMLLLAAGLVAHARIYPQRQQLDTSRPAFRELNFDIQTLTPLPAWEAWEFFRKQDLGVRTTPQYLEHRAKHRKLSYFLIGAWASAGLGAGLAGLSLVWRG
mgnify:CR=1 FL=1